MTRKIVVEPGDEPKRSVLDQGVFTAEEVDVRAITIRWDALAEAPMVDLGGIEPYQAHGWLQAAAGAVFDLTADPVIEDTTKHPTARRRRT